MKTRYQGHLVDDDPFIRYITQYGLHQEVELTASTKGVEATIWHKQAISLIAF